MKLNIKLIIKLFKNILQRNNKIIKKYIINL